MSDPQQNGPVKPVKNNLTNFLNKIRPKGASPGKTPPASGAVRRSRTPLKFNFFSRLTGSSKRQSSKESKNSVENFRSESSSTEDDLNVTPKSEDSFNNMNEVLQMTFNSPSPAPRATSEVDLRKVTIRPSEDQDSIKELKTQAIQFSSLSDVSGEIQSTPPSSTPRQPSYLNISRALNGYGYRNRLSPLNTPIASARPQGQSIVERRMQNFLPHQITSSSDSPTTSANASEDDHEASPMAAVAAAAAEVSTPVRDLASHFESLRLATPTGPPRQVKGFIRPVLPKIAPKPAALEVNHVEAASTNSATDGHYYERLLNQTRDELQKKVEQSLKLLEQEEARMAEDAADAVRVAQGKAALLIKKKLSKFDELVLKNLNPDSSTKLQETTVDDLAGYWGLIDIELHDIEDEFKNVEEWRSRDWQRPNPSPKSNAENRSPPPKPARTSKPVAVKPQTDARAKLVAKAPAANPKAEAQKAAEEKRRRQMREMKQAMMLKKQQQNGDADLIVE